MTLLYITIIDIPARLNLAQSIGTFNYPNDVKAKKTYVPEKIHWFFWIILYYAYYTNNFYIIVMANFCGRGVILGLEPNKRPRNIESNTDRYIWLYVLLEQG